MLTSSLNVAKYSLISKLFKTLLVLSFLICNVLMMWNKIRRNMNIRFLLLHLQILVDLTFLPVA